jgi:hypothetical protein
MRVEILLFPKVDACIVRSALPERQSPKALCECSTCTSDEQLSGVDVLVLF